MTEKDSWCSGSTRPCRGRGRGSTPRESDSATSSTYRPHYAELAELEKLVEELDRHGKALPDAFRLNANGCADLWKAARAAESAEIRAAPFGLRPLASAQIIQDDLLPDGAVLARIGGRWEVFSLPAPKEGAAR